MVLLCKFLLYRAVRTPTGVRAPRLQPRQPHRWSGPGKKQNVISRQKARRPGEKGANVCCIYPITPGPPSAPSNIFPKFTRIQITTSDLSTKRIHDNLSLSCNWQWFCDSLFFVRQDSDQHWKKRRFLEKVFSFLVFLGISGILGFRF